MWKTCSHMGGVHLHFYEKPPNSIERQYALLKRHCSVKKRQHFFLLRTIIEVHVGRFYILPQLVHVHVAKAHTGPIIYLRLLCFISHLFHSKIKMCTPGLKRRFPRLHYFCEEYRRKTHVEEEMGQILPCNNK